MAATTSKSPWFGEGKRQSPLGAADGDGSKAWWSHIGGGRLGGLIHYIFLKDKKTII